MQVMIRVAGAFQNPPAVGKASPSRGAIASPFVHSGDFAEKLKGRLALVSVCQDGSRSLPGVTDTSDPRAIRSPNGHLPKLSTTDLH